MAGDLESLRKAAAKDPAQTVRFCDALIAEDRADEAVAACEQAIAARPEDVPLRLALGRALSAAGRFEEAQQVLLEATQRGPQSSRRRGEHTPTRSTPPSKIEQRLAQVAETLRGGKSLAWDVDDPVPQVAPDHNATMWDALRASSVRWLWIGLAIFAASATGGFIYRTTVRTQKIKTAIAEADARAAKAVYADELLANQTYASILRTDSRRRFYFALVAQAAARLATDHGQDSAASAWAMLRRAEKEKQPKPNAETDERTKRELTAARALLALQRGESCPQIDDSFGDIAARCAQQRGDLDAARKILTHRLEETQGGDVRALLALGSLELGSGDLDAADAAYQKVLLKVPNHPRAIIGKAMVALERGDAAGAPPARAEKLGPVTESWFHLAAGLRLLSRGKEGDEALAQRELAESKRGIVHDGRLALLYGRAQLQQGRVAEAEQAMRVAQHLNPNDTDGMVLDAEVALAKGFEDKVVSALAVGPPTPRKLSVLGRAQCLVGRYKEAVATLDAALKRRPGDATAFTYRAIAQAHLGGAAQAVRDLERAAEKMSSTTPRYGLGLLAYERRDLTRARVELSRALERNPESFRARGLLGQVYRDLGKPKDALVELERAAREAPALLTVHQTLGQLYFDLGRDREARAELRTVLDGGKATPKDRLTYIEIAASLGYLDEAQKLLGELTVDKTLQPRLDRVRLYLQTWRGGKEAATATKGLEKLRKGPGGKDSRFQLELANAYRRAGDVKNAEAILRGLISVDALHAQLGLGRSGLQQNAYDAAEIAFRAALNAWEAGPYGLDDQTEARIGLGRALIGKKALSEAVTTLSAALKDDPNAPEVRYWLAKAYDLNGDKDKARAQAEKATELDDRYPDAFLLLGDLFKTVDAQRAQKAYKRYLELDPNGDGAKAVKKYLANPPPTPAPAPTK